MRVSLRCVGVSEVTLPSDINFRVTPMGELTATRLGDPSIMTFYFYLAKNISKTTTMSSPSSVLFKT